LDADCGVLEYDETEGVITSPNYPDLYPNKLKCGYTITSPNSPIDGSITITFDAFDIEFHQNCSYDFLSVSLLSFVTSLLSTFCFSAHLSCGY